MNNRTICILEMWSCSLVVGAFYSFHSDDLPPDDLSLIAPFRPSILEPGLLKTNTG